MDGVETVRSGSAEGGAAAGTQKGRNAMSRPPVCGLAWLGNVPSLGSLRTVDDLELDRLALFERTKAVPGDGGVVDEHVAPALTLDEPEPLRVVEPLDLACDAHRSIPTCKVA